MGGSCTHPRARESIKRWPFARAEVYRGRPACRFQRAFGHLVFFACDEPFARVDWRLGPARARGDAPADAVGLLYDTTRCIGCKACMVACREANGLEPDTRTFGPQYHAPVDLNEKAKTVIKYYDDGDTPSCVG